MLSEKTLRHPILMLMVFLMLLIIGLFTISNISIALFPDIDMPYLMISSSYTNADPESVENSVTKPIENALVSITHLESISSTSSEGRSTVSLEFAYGTDLDQAANDVREKLDRVTRSLPDNVNPTILKMNMSSDSIMRIALRGNRSADDLKRYAENVVVDILEQADGVGEASAMGGRTKLVRVELELNRLQAYGMTLSQVSSSLAKQNVDLGGGSITEGILDYSIRTAGLYSSIEEINNTVVTTKNGYDIKLSDLGRAYMGFGDASNEVYINGEPGVYISISKQSGANTVTVADAVYKKIEEVEKVLPSDIHLEIISDSSESIRDTLSTLFDAAWQGLVLAVIILYLFLCSMKSTIIIAISIPLSIVITVLCMNFAGITLNLVTLTGLILGVGMIVDASIVMIDNIYTYRSRGAKPRVAAVLGSSEMLMSVFSGNLTTICVFVPFLFFLKDLGMMGQLFKGIIFTVVISLVSSLFVAIFLVPVLAGYFLPLTNRNEKPLRNPFFKIFYAALNKVQDIIRDYFYRPVLKAALNHRLITILICCTALIVSLMMIPTMRISMMTGGSDSSVTLRITLPLGTTLSETSRVVNEFQEIIKEEVKGYKTLIVTTGSGGRNGGSNSGSIEIVLPESSEQIDNSQTIQGKLRPHFADFPSVTFSFGRGMRQQMAGDDLDVVLRSASLSDAMGVAEQIVDVMNSIEDIGEPSLDTDDGLPQMEIVINRTRAYNFGVSVSAVASEIQACIEGKTVTTYTQGGDDYSVKVMLRDEDVKSVPDLEQIFVQGSKGLVAVSNVATVIKGYGPVTIRRENRSRIIHITAGILTQTNANVVEDMLKEKIADTFVIPDSVSVSYEGSWKTMNEQTNIYGKIILLAILLVFAVMAATYESFKAPLINITTIPFLIIGVVAIYKITGQTASMLSAIGIIMLVGIVVNNGIILVDYTNLLIDRGYKMKEACLEAGTSRLRPVLMTTLTTILGMLPMCFATSGSAGMVQPIGVAVVGGLTSSTFITLFFIPVLYSLIMREKKQKKSRIQVTLPEDSAGWTVEGKPDNGSVDIPPVPSANAGYHAADDEIDFEDGIEIDGFDLASEDDGLEQPNLWAGISVEEIEKAVGPLGDGPEMKDVDFKEPEYPPSGIPQFEAFEPDAAVPVDVGVQSDSAVLPGPTVAAPDPQTSPAAGWEDVVEDEDEDDIERAIDAAFDTVDEEDADDGWSDFMDDEAQDAASDSAEPEDTTVAMDADTDVAMNAEAATDAALDTEAVAPEIEEAFEEPELSAVELDEPAEPEDTTVAMDADTDVAMNTESATDAVLDTEAVAPEIEEAFEEPELSAVELDEPAEPEATTVAMDVDRDVAMNAESATEAVAPEGEEAFEEPKLKFDSDAEDDIWPKLSIEPVLNPMESSEELEDKQEEDIWPQPKLAPEASTESASSVPAAFATSAPAKSATTPAAPTDAPVAPAAPVALAKPAATSATAPISTAPVAPAKPVAESAAKPVAASDSAASSEIEPAPTAIPTPDMPTPVAAPEPAVPAMSS
ncbi:MAG: efflux RND transporter permease subunit, partial [Treponema sp.]|nr:efflux RND transporter permease subunit [Treponema sp.]